MAAASTPGNKQTAASPVHQRVVLGVEQAKHASIEQALFYSFPTTQPSCQSSRAAHVLRASKANTSNTEKQFTANTQDNIQLGYTGALAVSQPSPRCPLAPTADIIVRSVFHRRNSSTKSQKKNCHQTCRSRHSANLRTNYVAARSQQCAPVCKVAFTASCTNCCPLA